MQMGMARPTEGGMSVERLTEMHFKKADGFYMKCSGHCCKEDFSCEDCGEFEKLVDRLGQIEDILGDIYDLDRLRELVEADKSGRCTIISTPERIMFYENLEHDIDPDRLRELVEADKDGRCVMLPNREHTNEDGENALKSAMNTCYYHNNPVTRYIADAVAEKLTREAALEKEKQDGKKESSQD